MRKCNRGKRKIVVAIAVMLIMDVCFLGVEAGTWSTSYDSPAWGIYSLAIYNGKLYAGTGESGIIYVYDGITWSTNYELPFTLRIYSLAVYNGKLYAGTGDNGVIYVYDGTTWSESYNSYQNWIYSLAVYNGKLYAGSALNGVIYVYDGTTWSESYDSAEQWIWSLAVYNGKLYAGTYPNGLIYVYDGTTWSTSYDSFEWVISSLAAHNGKLYAGTFPSGLIYVYDGTTWGTSYDTHQSYIYSLAEYNGKLYAGTCYNGIVYVYDGTTWSISYDSPESYIWSLAVYDGKLYAGSAHNGIIYVYDGKQTLTINKLGSGTGTVSSSPTGIDCGLTCNYDFDYNTSVTLTATADTGSTFVGWSGDSDCSDGMVTMDADKICMATFNIQIPVNIRYIPFVQNTSSFYSNIQIINVGTASATATVRMRNSSGSIAASKDTPAINVGAYYQINQIIPWLGSSATEGYLEIESTQPIVVTGQFITKANNDPSNMVGRKYEEATDGPLSVSVAGLTDWKSSLVINNLGTSAATIELNEYDNSTGAILATKTTSIPAQGYFYNNDIVAYMGLSATYGQLTVRSTNGQPLLVGTRNYNGNFGGYFDGQKIADADTTTILPYAIYSSQFYSNIQIINVGTSPTTATIYAINSSGANIKPPKTTASIPVNGYLQINNILQWMGASSGSSGYVKVVSNSAEKLVTTGQFITSSNNDPSNMVGRRASEAGTVLSVSVAGLTDWKSSLSIVNLGTSTANITLKEFNIGGTLLATKTTTIPVNAIWYQNDIVAYMGLTSTYGFLEIISTNGQPVIAGTRNYNGNFGGFFNGQNIASIV